MLMESAALEGGGGEEKRRFPVGITVGGKFF
jgi:hypothetical protein